MWHGSVADASATDTAGKKNVIVALDEESLRSNEFATRVAVIGPQCPVVLRGNIQDMLGECLA
jgi:hypothetical protein